jgi:hypothetical protein
MFFLGRSSQADYREIMPLANESKLLADTEAIERLRLLPLVTQQKKRDAGQTRQSSWSPVGTPEMQRRSLCGAWRCASEGSWPATGGTRKGRGTCAQLRTSCSRRASRSSRRRFEWTRIFGRVSAVIGGYDRKSFGWRRAFVYVLQIAGSMT